jgi:hypothetical protein
VDHIEVLKVVAEGEIAHPFMQSITYHCNGRAIWILFAIGDEFIFK